MGPRLVNNPNPYQPHHGFSLNTIPHVSPPSSGAPTITTITTQIPNVLPSIRMTKPDNLTAATEASSLISSHPSTSGLQISLHPLALLTISDYITRHTLRNGTGPIIGALLGTQEGREIAIEHAYEILLLVDDDGVRVEETWFTNKLRLCTSLKPYLFLTVFKKILPLLIYNPALSQRNSSCSRSPRLVHYHLIPHLRPITMDGLPSQTAPHPQRIPNPSLSQPVSQRLHWWRWEASFGNL